MIEIIVYLYAALGSLSLGYFVLRVGWPDIRANSSEYKFGLGMIMGLIFVIMGVVFSLIVAIVFPILNAFDLFLPLVFVVSLVTIFLLRFVRRRSSKTFVGVPINYAKFKTGKLLNLRTKLVNDKKIKNTQKNISLNLLSGFKRESKAVFNGVVGVFDNFFNSVKPIKILKHKKDLNELKVEKLNKVSIKDLNKVDTEELGELINSKFKKPSNEEIVHTIKLIDVEGLSKKFSEERLREKKEEEKNKKKFEKEEIDKMAEVIIKELQDKKALKRKTLEERRRERSNRTKSSVQMPTRNLQENTSKNNSFRKHGRHRRHGQNKNKELLVKKNNVGLGLEQTVIDDSSFDDLFSDSKNSIENNKNILGEKNKNEMDLEQYLFAEDLGSDSFESIGSLLTDDVDLESISNESGDNFESQFVEVKATHKKGCPSCGTNGTRVVFCSSCGSAMCSHCADGVDSEGDIVTFTCPKCKEKTTVKN